MNSKRGVTFVALAFAVPFGAAGVASAWEIASMLGESYRAKDWVVVQAKVESARPGTGGRPYEATYRYTVKDRQYVGSQLGFSSGTDNIGNWHKAMASFMDDARSTGRSIPVYVNPDNPAYSVVDRDVRWGLVAFLTSFAVMFGGVGVGAAFVLGRIWFGKAKAPAVSTPKSHSATVASGARKGAIGIWIVAIFWNAISFPIAAMTVAETVRHGNTAGLFVLLFPLFGIVLLWSAIHNTMGYMRRGRAVLAIDPADPRMGGRMKGSITFPRGESGGEFKVRLSASAYRGTGGDSKLAECWGRDVSARAQADPRGGIRIPFQFEVPASVAPREERAEGGEDDALAWKVALFSKGGAYPTDEFPIEMQSPL